MTGAAPPPSAGVASGMGQSIRLRSRQGLLYADAAQIAIARGRLERPLALAQRGEPST